MKAAGGSSPNSEEDYDETGVGEQVLDEHKSRILNETKNVSSFVVIGQTLHKLYYGIKLKSLSEDKLMKTQKEFLEWTKQNLGFSKSTTYEYIISYRIYSEIASKIGKEYRPPMYQSHCQLLSKVPQKKLVETWVDVCRQAPNGVITTAFLESYLSKNNLRSKVGRISMSSSAVDGYGVDGEGLANGDDEENEDEPDSQLIRQDSGSSAHSLQLSDDGNSRPGSVKLPINEPLIFELSKSVIMGGQFDMILQCVEDFRAAEPRIWFGRLWANLTSVRPLTTATMYSAPSSSDSTFEGGLEHLLRIIFTKFANKEFSEGLFLLRAEFGADWFTPILQHPYCILRHTNPPGLIPTPTLPPPTKRQKRTSNASTVGGTLPPFESYVMFYLGPNIKEFCHVFRAIGLVPGVNSWSAVMSVNNNVMSNVGLLNVQAAVAASSAVSPETEDAEDAAAAAAAAVQLAHAASAGSMGPHGSISEAASALVDIART
ncbi:hypothetical protein HDU96_001140 [Phlyctochytrium bullatum]|nr:hypothetical protein HDU96_001140 [Phlyctochytrium bullatum]